MKRNVILGIPGSPGLLALMLVFGLVVAGCGDSDSGGLLPGGSDNSAPANVGALEGIAGNALVTLAWLDPVDTDLDRVEITVAPAIPNGNATISAPRNVGTWIVEGLANGTLYTFTVKAVDTSGNKSAGVSCQARPSVGDSSDILPPANVSGHAAIPGDARITLIWTDPIDADLNSIEITVTPAVTGSPFAVAKGTASKIVGNLVNGVSYTFTLKTVDMSGNKSGGVSVAATPGTPDSADKTPPANVTALNAAAGNALVTLTWTDPADADLALIEITVAPPVAGSPFTVGKGAQTRLITGLTNGQSYTFTAKAVDASGNRSTGANAAALPVGSGDTGPEPPGAYAA
jgi:predicted phage tail protein